MSRNNKTRLDRALDRAKALAAAKQKRFNPLLAVEWLPAVQVRARQALARIGNIDLGDVTEEFVDEVYDAIGAIVKERWDRVLECAASCAEGRLKQLENSPYAMQSVGFFDVFPGWLELVPPELMVPTCRLIPWEHRRVDKRGDVLDSWLGRLASKDVEMPQGMTTVAMAATIRCILDADPATLGFTSWCGKCLLICPMKTYSVPPPWELLATCPYCGNAENFRNTHHPENHKATYPPAVPV